LHNNLCGCRRYHDFQGVSKESPHKWQQLPFLLPLSLFFFDLPFILFGSKSSHNKTHNTKKRRNKQQHMNLFTLIILSVLTYMMYNVFRVFTGCAHCQGIVSLEGKIMPGVKWSTMCEIGGVNVQPKILAIAFVVSIVIYSQVLVPIFTSKSSSMERIPNGNGKRHHTGNGARLGYTTTSTDVPSFLRPSLRHR
jgi:hypothetical protein